MESIQKRLTEYLTDKSVLDLKKDKILSDFKLITKENRNEILKGISAIVSPYKTGDVYFYVHDEKRELIIQNTDMSVARAYKNIMINHPKCRGIILLNLISCTNKLFNKITPIINSETEFEEVSENKWLNQISFISHEYTDKSQIYFYVHDKTHEFIVQNTNHSLGKKYFSLIKNHPECRNIILLQKITNTSSIFKKLKSINNIERAFESMVE